ncbi:MAG: hypothetical protein JNM97_22355 [Rhodoferax sp.]|nr:hypothetical protein [Rhodoferax sp.]
MTANAKTVSVYGTDGLQNYPSNIIDFPTADKTLATLKAQFALAGHQVHEGSNDDFIVTRWGMSRYCAGLDELRRFARVLGVRHG